MVEISVGAHKRTCKTSKRNSQSPQFLMHSTIVTPKRVIYTLNTGDFSKRLFNITDMSRYGIEARGLEPIYKQRYQITGIGKIQTQLRNIMLCELFLKFRKDGGVVR